MRPPPPRCAHTRSAAVRLEDATGGRARVSLLVDVSSEPWWDDEDAKHIRIIGYSPSAGFVLTVIIDPQDNSGVTAWKARGVDLRDYLECREAPL